MDNPQPYQPLSHALALATHYPTSAHHAPYTQHEVTEPQNHRNVRQHVEDEEEEEEDEDEGLVEEQLHQTDAEMRVSRPTSPKGSASDPQSSNPPTSTPAMPEKRRPGRPRGSKNRKPRASAKNESQFSASQQGSYATPTIAALPSHPNITPQNQHYYEFQWRMLNLCAEFYGAAEELVKAASPLVIAQCYQLGPGVKVDPVTMLVEAKRICDTLLANPSQLVTNPPPPVYPVLPTISVYPPVLQPPIAGPSTSTATPTPSVAANITTPGTSGVPSFVVPLNQPPYPQYPVYGSAQHTQYPTAPYYQYASTYPYFPPPHPVGAPSVNTSATTNSAAATTVNGAPWSEDESERLRKLVDESKSGNQAGKVDWEWVVGQWGSSRSKSQILRHATALNLKESTARGTKRRREEGQTDVSGASATPVVSSSAATGTTQGAIPMSSPDPSASHSTSTATPSPALQSQQRPPSSAALSAPSAPPTTSTTTNSQKMPWPMPTVAVPSAVPILPTPTPTSGTAPSTSPLLSGHAPEQRSTYYRPRPANNSPDAGGHQQQQQQQQHQLQQHHHHHQSTHHYFLTPNGHGQTHGGMPYRQKENGE